MCIPCSYSFAFFFLLLLASGHGASGKMGWLGWKGHLYCIRLEGKCTYISQLVDMFATWELHLLCYVVRSPVLAVF